MKALYIGKVLQILGGFRNTAEIVMAEKCYFQHMTPNQAAQVICNNR